MPTNEDFYEMWLNAPEVYKWSSVSNSKVIALSKGPKDEEAAKKWRGDTFLEGTGSRENPFHGPAADHSPHFGVFEMWFILRSQKRKKKPLFIEVNDMLFYVTSVGVITEDGQLTQFLS